MNLRNDLKVKKNKKRNRNIIIKKKISPLKMLETVDGYDVNPFDGSKKLLSKESSKLPIKVGLVNKLDASTKLF